MFLTFIFVLIFTLLQPFSLSYHFISPLLLQSFSLPYIFISPLPFHLPTTLYINIILPLSLHLPLFLFVLIHTLLLLICYYLFYSMHSFPSPKKKWFSLSLSLSLSLSKFFGGFLFFYFSCISTLG